jgi:hypothetical protein
MASPFRYNKKARKRLRRAAKRRRALAEQFEQEQRQQFLVDGFREMADMDLKQSLSKRKKNKRHQPKPQN